VVLVRIPQLDIANGCQATHGNGSICRRRESPVTASASILDTSFASGDGTHDDEMLVWTPSKAAIFDENDMLRIV
jgi:hypothetical protein